MPIVEDPFKELAKIFEPDQRSTWRQVYDPTVGLRPMTLEDHHAIISDIALLETVPVEVRQRFDTAKNLCLYSWFECRFHQPAELWAYGALELALQEKAKIASPDWWEKQTEDDRLPGLKWLIAKAKTERWVTNEGFEMWRRHQQQAAYHQASNELTRKMSEQGLTEAELPDFDDFEGVIGDPAYCYITVLESTIPHFRNLMAHGWPKIMPGSSPGMLRRCAEFINQLFSAIE